MTAILNKKVLLAGSVIVAVAAAALGATYAAWQAAATIDGNTVSTATMSITAVGAQGGAPNTVAKPVDEEDVLPGFISFPAPENVARGLVTNNSSVALDLYMYFDNIVGDACDATKIAWQSSQPNSTTILGGYAIGSEPTVAGLIGDMSDPDLGELSLVGAYAGVGNAVKIADDSYFVNGAQVALRQISAFASDASYPDHAGSCTWDEIFVATLPDQSPTAYVPAP